VLTKLDLMDSGTNALDILQGRGGYPLKLGFIGIVNRSQKDIDENKPMSEAIDDEQRFFETHPVYKTIAYKSGTKFLAKTLNSVCISEI
jgi:dynamin 1-like protein